MWRNMKKPIKIYLCGTDLTDLSLGATDVVMFPTLKSLKKNRKCLDECGYISCEINNIKILKKPNFKMKRSK
jgi:hypothetical protein